MNAHVSTAAGRTSLRASKTLARCSTALLLSLLGTVSANAQSAGADTSVAAETSAAADAIETITVTAHRLPASDPVLVPLQRSYAGEAGVGADVLRSLPGLAISQSGNLGGLTQVRARGAEANHLLVLIDGFEVNDPAADGEFNFANMALATTPSVEYLPGAQSAIWGSDAVAGVLHLSTAPRTSNFELRAQGGSFNTNDLVINAAQRGERGYYRISAQRFDTDGTNVSRDGSEDDGFRSKSILASGARTGEGWQIEGLLRRISTDSDFDPAPFPAFLPVDGDNHTEHESTLAGVTARLLDLPGNLSQHLSLSLLTTNNLGYAGATRTGYSDAQRRTVTSISRWQPGDQSHLDLVLEYQQERFEQQGIASFFGDPNQKQRVEQYSGGLDWRFTPLPALALSVSARFDSNSDFDDSVSYRFAARYAVSDSLSLWTNIGTGIKNPSFIERFGFTPDTFFGNPNIEPETSEHQSVGVVWEQRGWRTALTLFNDRLEDEINGFAFDGALGGFTAENRDGTSKRRGGELEAGYQTAAAHVLAGISYVDSEDPDGVREIRRPQWLGFVEASRTIGAFSVWTRFSHIDEQRDLSFATFPATVATLDSYNLWTARLDWQVTPWLQLGVRGDNLLDETYEDILGFRGPGRGGYVEVRLTR